LSTSEAGLFRTLRIAGTATLVAFLFRLSQSISREWGNEEVGGYAVALGVVSLLFLVRAAATEYAGRNVTVVQRDFLWGISLGTFLSMLARILR
jgi:hypothetical protein